MQPSTTQVLTAAALSCMLLLYLQRRRLPTRRAAIEIRDEATVMLVADVDYQQKRVLREVHLREVKHSASRRLEDVVRALSRKQARRRRAGHGVRGPKVSVGTSVLRAVEARWRRSRCDGAFDLRVVFFFFFRSGAGAAVAAFLGRVEAPIGTHRCPRESRTVVARRRILHYHDARPSVFSSRLLDAREGRDGVVEDVAQHRARPRVAPRQRIIEFGRDLRHQRQAAPGHARVVVLAVVASVRQGVQGAVVARGSPRSLRRRSVPR